MRKILMPKIAKRKFFCYKKRDEAENLQKPVE